MHFQINGLAQVRRNSIANALELRLSCTNLSKCGLQNGSLSVIWDRDKDFGTKSRYLRQG